LLTVGLGLCISQPTNGLHFVTRKIIRAYQHPLAVCGHFRKAMSHSVFPLVRHVSPVTLTRHARGISRIHRGAAAYDITRTKHRVPFSHPTSLRSLYFAPQIRAMAPIAVIAHNDFICSDLTIFVATKPEDPRDPSHSCDRGRTNRPDCQNKGMVPPKRRQHVLPVDPRLHQ
jgi:hypothetical protein